MSEATARTSRWRAFAPDTAGAIYGTIAAMAVIAGTAADPSHARPLSLTVATLFVFWLAHVYAQTLPLHLRRARRLEWSAVRTAMAEERPLLEGAAAAAGRARSGNQRGVRPAHRAPRGGRALTGLTAARSRPRPPAGPAGGPGTR